MRFAGLLGLVASPAVADVTAVYSGREYVKLEIANNGDMRAEMRGDDGYYVFHRGKSYVVDRGADGRLRVRRFEDVNLVLKQLLEREIQSQKDYPKRPLVLRGRVTINGRAGTAYAETAEKLYPSETPEIVIGDDSSLLPLAKVATWMLEAFAMTSSGGVIWPDSSGKRDLLKSGAPIFFLQSELSSVSTAQINRSRFELPAAPQTIEQIRRDPPILYEDQGR